MRILFGIVLSVILLQGFESKIAPSEVFGEAETINRELTVIKQHFEVKAKASVEPIYVEFRPRHVWQLSYIILVKINVLRLKHNLPRVEEVALEPVADLNPDLVYEQTQRILTELRIFKKRLGITQTIKKAPTYSGKTPSDVFHKLLLISAELDLLIGRQIAPSDVFAQVMRLYADVSIIHDFLEIKDTTIPPKKKQNARPADAFATTAKFLDRVNRLQKSVGISRTDFDGFKRKVYEPRDVFLLVGMTIAELQTIKAYLGIQHTITPPAKVHEGKRPADVEQLMGWAFSRLKLIKSLDRL